MFFHAVLIEVLVFVIIAMLGVLVKTLRSLLSVQREHRKALEDERESISSGILSTLRSQMIEYHDKWVNRGFNTPYGLESYLHMHDAYIKLGGNGLIEQLHIEIMQLPIRKKGGSE